MTEIKPKIIKKENRTVENETTRLSLLTPVPQEWLTEYKVTERNGEEKVLTTYNAQYAINLLNETFGLFGWEIKEEIFKDEVVGNGFLVAIKISLSIPLLSVDKTITGYGSCFTVKYDTAIKGARSSALKNACRLLGIGAELYKNSTEEEVKEESHEAVYEAGGEQEVPGKKPIELGAEETRLRDWINNSDSLEEMNLIKEDLKSITNEVAKKTLVKMFNNKKIFLIEKNGQTTERSSFSEKT